MSNDIPDVLEKICANTRIEVDARKTRNPLSELEAAVRDLQATRGFVRAIKEHIEQGRAAVIAECKKASPSKGVIRLNYDAAQVAAAYEAAGASCLSVLTDEKFFQGSLKDLSAARGACELPILRKDFMVDAYQIYEARVAGADCILLIAAVLSDAQMREFTDIANSLGMDVLVEVHDRAELSRAHVLRVPLIGINNRDLRTFNTDLRTTIDLLPDVMYDRTLVTESGIHTVEDVQRMRANNVNAFLVGEAFMSAEDPGEKLKALFELPA